MKFSKYHALGNDYIVIDPKDLNEELTTEQIKTICHRNFGVGSDGILYGPEASEPCEFSLRIFNPDGSEAEKSGNGLRIFSRYLWDQELVAEGTFSIETKGGVVDATVSESGFSVSVGMGKVRFTHQNKFEPAISAKKINVADQEFTYYEANVGNPHCVIIVETLSNSPAKTFGSLIENDARFSNRTNVQFVQILDRNNIQIEIWERGAGYTLASGSSSTAAASVSKALDLCDENIDVHMPGGTINIVLSAEFNATMTGAVRKICDGELASEVFTD